MLLGIVAGFVIAATLGRVNMDGVTHAPWVGIVLPFHFGLPHFDPLSIATMIIVMFVTFIESTGMFLAVGDWWSVRSTRRRWCAACASMDWAR